MQHRSDGARTHAPAVCRQRRGQLRAALACPAQRRGRIAPRERVYQALQRGGQARLVLLQIRSAGPGPANAPGRRAITLGQLAPTLPDRLGRQPSRSRDQCVAAVPDGNRLRRRPQATGALIEDRRHHHGLGDDRGFEILVASHTRVRSQSVVRAQGNSGQRPYQATRESGGRRRRSRATTDLEDVPNRRVWRGKARARIRGHQEECNADP